MLRQWQVRLSDDRASGARTREAIAPYLREWIGRRFGCLSYHATQLLTGHGCFGTFLARIGKADSAACAFCGDGETTDSPEHTLGECPKWEVLRGPLRGFTGDPVTLRGVVGAILRDGSAWRAFVHFSGSVMLAKEARERAGKG